MTKLTAIASLATLSEGSSGELILAGQLDYRNGKYLSKQGANIIHKSSAKQFILSCSGVTRTTSVGLSLVLSLIREATRVNKVLTIKSLTFDLEEIAKFSGIFELLPLDPSFTVIAKN